MIRRLIFILLLASPAMGAEFLIRPVDNPSVRGYKRGDIVIVMPDGHEWGGEEKSAFYIVKVTDVTVEQAKQYAETGASARRRWWLDINSMAATPRTTLTTTGTLTTTWSNIKASVKNKETGQSAP